LRSGASSEKQCVTKQLHQVYKLHDISLTFGL
jgi:hypothetical protein